MYPSCCSHTLGVAVAGRVAALALGWLGVGEGGWSVLYENALSIAISKSFSVGLE